MVVDTEPILASGPRALYYRVIEAAAGFRVSPSVPLLERLYYGIEWVRPSSVQAFGVGHCTTGSVCGLFGASALAIVLRGLSVVWPMFETEALYYGTRPSSAQCWRSGHCTTGSMRSVRRLSWVCGAGLARRFCG